MMRFTHTFLIAALLAAPAFASAQSYMTPEQVLQSDDSAFLVPGRQRGARRAADLQAEQSALRHPSMIEDPRDGVAKDALPPATTGTAGISGTADVAAALDVAGYQQQTIVDPVTARLLARLLAKESLLQAPGSSLQSTAGASGAPLTGSGPMTTIAALAVIPAGIWTLRRARMLQRFL